MIKNANWNECHLNRQSAYSSCLPRSTRLHLFAGGRGLRFSKEMYPAGKIPVRTP